MAGYSATEVFEEKVRARYNGALKAFKARGIDVLEAHKKDKDALFFTVRDREGEVVAVSVARQDKLRQDQANLDEVLVAEAHRTEAYCAILARLHNMGYFRFVRKPASDEEHAFLVGPMRFEAFGGAPDYFCGFNVY